VSLGVTLPAALWALAVLPGVFVLARRRGRAAGAAALRATAITLLVLALAGLYVERPRPATGACVVVATDVSASAQTAAPLAAHAFLEPMLATLDPDDLVGAIAFGGRVQVLAAPAPRPALATLLPPAGVDPGAYRPEETDLGAAVVRAAVLCPADRQPAIVLVTDGRETTGSLAAEVARMTPPVPLFAVVPPPDTLPAVTLRRLLAPAFLTAGAPAPLEAVVENATAERTTAVLQVAIDAAPPLAVPLDLPPGPSVVALPFPSAEPGAALVQARLLLRDGEPPAPGFVSAAVTVTPPLRALVASERTAPVVAAALAQRGMTVEVVPPRAIEPALGRQHVVVLDDVARSAFAPGGLEALAAWVADGGGLVVTGGPHTFGDPALASSALARVLPVALSSQTPEPAEREPIALELVIDRSNSMSQTTRPGAVPGEKMAYARRAAMAVLAQLEPQDLVGAIAFDAEPHELGALQPVAVAREALAARVATLEAGGGTDFLDALDIARRNLERVEHRVRHIVLLTDGDTNRRTDDHFQLIDALARGDVTVSTIRIGTDTANLALLATIARATGGEFHHVENPEALPQLMLNDARELFERARNRNTRRVRIADGGAPLAGIAPRELPPVAGWAIARAKPGATVRLAVDAGEREDPVLVTWQHGLGRVAAVTLDFQAGAAPWATWNGFGKLWTQLVRWTARRALPDDVHLEAHATAAATRIVVETAAEPGDPPALEIDDHALALAPEGPRRWTARLPPLAPGPHPATIRGSAGAWQTLLRVPEVTAGDRERRGGPPDRALLERAAARTGGRVDPEPADVLAARGGVARTRTPLETPLVALALAAILADVALRRLAR